MAESLESFLQIWVNMAEEDRESLWRQGDFAILARERYGKAIFGDLAAIRQCTVRWIQQLARVAEMYPKEIREEFAELPWAVFSLAAAQSNPVQWLEKAYENGWSEADLRKAIRGERPPTDKVERLLKQVEKMLSAKDDQSIALQDGLLAILRQYRFSE